MIRSHASIIERAPLQAYASALVFTPTASEVRAAQWKHRLPFIERLGGIKTHWDSYRQTLEEPNTVESVAFSPSGKMLASASWGDGAIRLWEVSTGSLKQTLKGHSDRVSCVAFSPDGKILASASHDNTVRLWEMSTQSHKRTLEGHIEPVNCVAFSPDGKILASSSDDRMIRLWDTALGSCRQTIEGHCNRVKSVTFSPDGKILASAADHEPIRLWDMATGKHQQTLETHDGLVPCAAFSPDGSILAVSLHKNAIQLWDTGLWSLRQTLWTKFLSVFSLAFSPDGKMLAFEGSNEVIQLWDVATGSMWSEFTGHNRGVNSIVYSPDGMTLASASSDYTIRLWDVDLTNRQRTIEEPSKWTPETATFMAFSPNGEKLVLASDNGFQVWDTATWSCQQTITQEAMAYKLFVVFSPDGKTLAVTRPDGVQLWDTDTPTWTCRLTQKGAQPFNPFMAPNIAFSPDSKTLATASQEETIRLWLWDATSGSTLWTLRGKKIHFVAFSPDGKTLASATQGSVALWDTATRSQQRNLSFEAARSLYLRLAFSHDSKILALSLLGAILLWNTTTWECRELFAGASRLSLAFSSDDAYLLSDYQPIRLSSTSASSTQRFDEHSSGIFLHFDEEWICLNTKQILWLPEDYRLYPGLVSVHANKIAWTNRGGRLSLLQVTGAEVMP